MNHRSGICTFCGTGCGHLLDVSNGRVNGVFPVQNHPVSKGRLCVRGWHVHELLNTAETIKTPLVRKNGALVEVSYEEAVAFLVENLLPRRQKASDEIGFLASPRSSNEENYLLMKTARAVFGTNNISLDTDPAHRVSMDVMYQGTGMAGMLGSLEEISRAEYLLVAGIDITKQNPIIGSEIHKASMAGATLVTIDTRATQIAKLSKRFLQIRPGAYGIAAAYMTKTIIDERLYDADFIKSNTQGIDALMASLASLTDAEVAEKTGIDPAVLAEEARAIGRAKSAMIFFSSGISGFDRDTIACLFNLFLAAGKIGGIGCGVNPITGINNLQGSYDMGIAPDLLTGYQPLSDAAVVERFSREWGAALNAKAGEAVNDLLERGRLKALVAVDHDEMIVRHEEAIRDLEFVAYIGAYQNRYMDYAHVVLPIATYAAADGTYTNTERRVQLSKRKIDPGAVLPGWQLWVQIADKAGAKWNYSSPAEVMAEIARLTPTYEAIDYQKLSALGGVQWPCTAKRPKGTVRFDPAESGRRLSFVPVKPGFAVPVASEEYPILLQIGEAQHYWHQNNLMHKTNIPLREYNATLLLYPQGYVAISPSDAKDLGLKDRMTAKIVSPYGSMEAMVQVNDKIARGTAYVAYFVNEMITDFFMEHRDILKRGEDATIPVRIVKV